MSYYLVLVSPRDIPLYEADLHSKPSTSTSSSFFSSSSNTTTSTGAGGTTARGDNASPRPSTDSFSPTSSSGVGGVFGFGTALRDLTAGLNGSASAAASSSAAAGGGGAGAGATSSAATSKTGKGLGFGRYNDRHVLQMIAHSSLDNVEDWAVGSGVMYLKQVDRINEWSTSCLLVPGGTKFLILHEHRHDDGIRNFLLEVWEAFVKISLNPFFDANSPIQSSAFDVKVKASARKHL